MVNSTVYNNGFPSSVAGGIINKAANLDLTEVTIAGNMRGGLETDPGAHTTARAVILGKDGYGYDANNGSCVSAGHDYGRGTTAEPDHAGQRQQPRGGQHLRVTNVGDPRLAPLTDNGGASQTLALLYGSPALGAGSCDFANDQRGITRPASACDIGAFQAVRSGAPSVTDAGANGAIGDGADLHAAFSVARRGGRAALRLRDGPRRS